MIALLHGKIVYTMIFLLRSRSLVCEYDLRRTFIEVAISKR